MFPVIFKAVIQDTLTIHGVEHGIDVRSSYKLAVLALTERRWTKEMLLARFVLGFRAGVYYRARDESPQPLKINTLATSAVSGRKVCEMGLKVDMLRKQESL
jgi:hypothetical protein